jgi:DNA-repair protein complementing XP-A cells
MLIYGAVARLSAATNALSIFLLQEINRMKAKALREQREAEARNATTAASSSVAAGQKRPFSSIRSGSGETPANLRDGRAAGDRPLDAIRPARSFAKYVEYDFSKMTDTKGGFLSVEDDPHNRALHAGSNKQDEKPAHMTQKEWERQQLIQSLKKHRSGPFEPAIGPLGPQGADQKKCRECGSLEIDWSWDEIFKCSVCNTCKEKLPEKYSLLTKTEAREDYLLTDRAQPFSLNLLRFTFLIADGVLDCS